MKKNYTFYLSLLAIPVFALLFFSFGAGQNQFYVSGSPSDVADNGVGDCTLCHTGATVMTNSATINLIAPTDYALNTTYPITISSNSVAARQGFQLSVEDGRDNKVGDLTDDGSKAQVFDLGRGEAITHTGSGAFANPGEMHTWTFDWTSPATDVGSVTFYVALNESNQDFNSTGDQIHLKQSNANLLSVENAVFKDLKIYPNPANNFVIVDLPASLDNTNVMVYNFLGKIVLTQDIDTKNTIDISSLQAGVYLMQLTNNNSSITKRFVKK